MGARELSQRSDSDPVGAYSPVLRRLFVAYLRGYFGRHFSGVRTSRRGAPPTDTGPLIVYSNHPSWWDPIHFGLLAHYLLPERRLYGPMDAAALEKYGFFKKLGIFGVERSARGAAAFLRTSQVILAEPNASAPRASASGEASHPSPTGATAGREARPAASLWVTAEGQFTDPRQRPVRIQPGVAHLARRLENGWVVPLALEYPFWNERPPEALSAFGRPFDLAAEPERSTDEWTALLEARLAETMDSLAADAASRDPERFVTLQEGNVGVGGVYDRWRRLKALVRGKSFSAAHGEVVR